MSPDSHVRPHCVASEACPLWPHSHCAPAAPVSQLRAVLRVWPGRKQLWTLHCSCPEAGPVRCGWVATLGPCARVCWLARRPPRRGEVSAGSTALPAWVRGPCQAASGPQASGPTPLSMVCRILPLPLPLPGLEVCPSETGRHSAPAVSGPPLPSSSCPSWGRAGRPLASHSGSWIPSGLEALGLCCASGSGPSSP